MSGYNNDYNKDLYTAQSSDFCKSCYSSGKSRAGCLWAALLAAAVLFLYTVLAGFTSGKTAAAVTGLLIFAVIAAKIIKNKHKK